jgi:hypothetical protein
MEKNYEENDYENWDEDEEISSRYLAEIFIHNPPEKDYSVQTTEIIKLGEEKHQKYLEKIAIELLIEEYGDL